MSSTQMTDVGEHPHHDPHSRKPTGRAEAWETLGEDHILFLQECIQSGDFDQIDDFLSRPVWEFFYFAVTPQTYLDDGAMIPQADQFEAVRTVLKVQQFLSLGATAYFRAGNLKRAREYCHYVLATAISRHNTHYTIDSYKRWQLLNCLVSGKLEQPAATEPYGMNSSAAQLAKQNSGPYIALADAFGQGDRKQFDTVVVDQADVWSRDGTQAVVDLLEKGFDRMMVKRATFGYWTITLDTLSKQLHRSIGATALLVGQLIDRGEIEATLSTAVNGMPVLRLPIEPDARSAPKSDEHMLEEMTRLRNELAKVREQISWVQHKCGVDLTEAYFKLSVRHDKNLTEHRTRIRGNDPESIKPRSHPGAAAVHRRAVNSIYSLEGAVIESEGDDF